MSFLGTLGELCAIEKGTSPTLKTEPGKYPLVVTAEYRRSASTYQFDRPAVCIPLISSTGHGDAAIHRIHYQEGRFALANLLVALIPRDLSVCFPRYLYLMLQAQKDHLLVPLMRGTANVSLKEKDIANVQVSLPPLSEQKKIVEWIDAVASRVEDAKRLRASSNRAQAVLRSAAISRVLDRLEFDGTLGDVIDGKPRNGWSAKCDGAGDGVAVLSLAAVTGFRYRPDRFKKTSEPTESEAHYWLNPGDLLITRSNTPELVGHAAVYSGAPSPCIYPDLIMRIPVDPKRCVTRFVHYVLQSRVAREFIENAAKGTSPTMKKISQGTVCEIPFPAHLSLAEQMEVVIVLDQILMATDDVLSVSGSVAPEIDSLIPSTLNEVFGSKEEEA